MDKETYNRKNEELTRLIKTWCNGVGCEGCIFTRYDDDGKETGKCKVTELNNELMCVEVK